MNPVENEYVDHEGKKNLDFLMNPPENDTSKTLNFLINPSENDFDGPKKCFHTNQSCI